MKNFLGRFSHAFSAGAIGALFSSLTVWLLGWQGITAKFGVRMAPSLTPGWLYPRIVWGGLWGLFFLAPLGSSPVILKGLVISLLPALVTLLYILPFVEGRGFLGMELGAWTPAVVLFINLIWGLAAGTWIKVAGGER